MSVTSETIRTQTAGDGNETEYYFTFTIYEDTDLLVKVINDTTHAEITLALNSDYTVSVTGKYITLTSGNLCPAGSTLNLISNIPYTQETELLDGEAWSAALFNNALDKLTILDLQLKDAQDSFATLNNVLVQTDIASAISLKHSNSLDHTRNTDTILDNGGANQVTAVQAKNAYTHSQTNSGNPHSVTKSDVGLGNVTNDAQIKKISSSTDNAVARFDGITGDALQVSLVTVDDSGSVNIPSGQSYKINGTALAKSDVGLGSVDNLQQMPLSYLDTDTTLAANSDAKIASQKAVKTYADTKAAASHSHAATDVTSGTLDGDRLPALSETKKGGVPATGTPSGKYLKDDGTWAVISGTGDVIAPSTNTDNYLPQWNGANSKTLKNGLGLVTTLGSPGSDTNIPSEAAVRAAISTAGGGDVSGPSSSTANALTRFSGTSGKLVQNSSATIDDSGSINIPTGQSYKINGTALSASDVSAIPASQKAAASGVASLDSSSLVVQNPANATATPTASKIPIADSSGKLAAGWGGNASTLATLDSSSLVVENPANATATPTASKIPMADSSGKLAAGWGGSASTLATLDSSSLVVQNPANATATATASKIPIADSSGTLDSWVTKASASDINTGTNTTKAVTPDALAGSNFGIRYVELLITDSTALTTGDGKAYFRVPAGLNGMNLVSVAAHCGTVSSSGTPTFQVYNVTDSVDMLSTALTIDASENDSSTAATAAVINTSYDDVATGDWIRIDCDTAGTSTAWVVVELGFQLP